MPEDKKEVKADVKKEVKQAPTFTVGQVVTATAPALFYAGNQITIEETLALVLNKLERIEKATC